MARNELIRSARSIDSIAGLERVVPTYSFVEEIKSKLEETVFGQSEAMEALARAVGRHENGLNDPNHPLGVMFFSGPTGVGKTEAARALARYLFAENTQNLKVINCAEFSAPHTITRIIGAPPSYVGYGGPVLITRDFLSHRNVIVFDEIEKANPELWKLLLSVIDTAHLKSVQQTRININGEAKYGVQEVDLNFSNSYIIFTSNVGAEDINKRSLGFTSTTDDTDMKQTVRGAIDHHFKAMPEFLGRFEDIIVFNHLTETEYLQVFWKFIDEINSNMDSMIYHPYLTVTDNAARYLVQKVVGNGKYGAREMRSVINRELTQPLSDIISECQDRAFLVAELEGDKIVFYRSAELNPEAIFPIIDEPLPDLDEVLFEQTKPSKKKRRPMPKKLGSGKVL